MLVTIKAHVVLKLSFAANVPKLPRGEDDGESAMDLVAMEDSVIERLRTELVGMFERSNTVRPTDIEIELVESDLL